MSEEFRKGYDNPYAAESEDARRGAGQRRWDDERLKRRAAAAGVRPDYGAVHPPIDNPTRMDDSTGGPAALAERAPSSIGGTAKSCAILGALAALLFLYVAERWTLPMGIAWGLAGAVAGFIAGMALHVAVVVIGLAIRVGFWLGCAYVALRLLGVLH